MRSASAGSLVRCKNIHLLIDEQGRHSCTYEIALVTSRISICNYARYRYAPRSRFVPLSGHGEIPRRFSSEIPLAPEICTSSRSSIVEGKNTTLDSNGMHHNDPPQLLAISSKLLIFYLFISRFHILYVQGETFLCRAPFATIKLVTERAT